MMCQLAKRISYVFIMSNLLAMLNKKWQASVCALSEVVTHLSAEGIREVTVELVRHWGTCLLGTASSRLNMNNYELHYPAS
jgi:hypothetical protein